MNDSIFSSLVRRSRLQIFSVAFILFVAIFTPYYNFLGVPLHLTIPLLVLIAFVFLKINTRSGFIFLAGYVLFLGSIAINNTFFGVQSGLNGFYSPIAFLVIFLSAAIVSSFNLARKDIETFVFVLTFIFCFAAIVQWHPVFRDLYHQLGLLPSHRMDILLNRSYWIVVAPMANPNNTALVASILALCFLHLKFSSGRNSKMDVVQISSLLFMVSVVVLFSFARTVLVAFLISSLVQLVIFRKFSLLALFSLLMLIAILVFFGEESHFFRYYSTIASFQSEASMTTRYDYYILLFHSMREAWHSVFFGFGDISAVWIQLTGRTVIDSNYIWLIGSLGLIVFFLIVSTLIKFSMSYPRVFPFILFLAITSITLPYFTDFRISVILGTILGLIMIVERSRSREVVARFASGRLSLTMGGV